MTRGALYLAGDRPGASATPSKRALWWAELSEAERAEHDELLARAAQLHSELVAELKRIAKQQKAEIHKLNRARGRIQNKGVCRARYKLRGI